MEEVSSIPAKKILVIEDNAINLRMVSYALTKQGYEVITATNGLIGFKKINEEHPDLVILDIMLPGLDGYDICERVRMNPETEKLPIIMTSGKTLQDDKDIGMRLGASVYLTKPVPPSEMLTNVKSLLGEE